ncbi:ABC transporter substrate-binding protein [Parasulfuritortus cantonensis]|uniref:ABC transporter substrate-binding protein n=1 Tax=Parasulfuritortus cantonensis TaxID=2528202 RepID=A0A4R1BM90_9PROT|nr:ABC transporter substrate-binding protein [Parasulfuritortus cantonensis]TCJ18529.1 ABC transporter substrate-binding protein [Parasulfuritortus cantonensis]
MQKIIRLLFLPLALLASSAALAIIGPDTLARNTTNEVIQIVKQDDDIRNGRASKIYSVVETKILPHFDFQRMTKLAVARNWNTATPEQQDRLVDEFRALLVRTYAASLSSVAEYKVDFKPLRMAAGDTDVVVNSEVSKPGAPPITIDYRMEKMSDAWKVYDVMVDGVSLVTVYRNSFNSEVRKGGIDGLIETLSRRNQRK